MGEALLWRLLQFHPHKRITIEDALKHVSVGASALLGCAVMFGNACRHTCALKSTDAPRASSSLIWNQLWLPTSRSATIIDLVEPALAWVVR
jgi:hypothetical protein